MVTLILTLLMVGCATPDPNPGQSGEESIGCLAVATEDYPLADTTPLGFTGQALVDLVAGDHDAALTWEKGGGTELVVGVATAATSVTWRDMEWEDDGSGAEVATMEAGDCPDDVRLSVTLDFTTADGAFAESWSLDLGATAATEAAAYTEIDLGALGGSYAVTEVDPSEYDAVRAFLELTIDSAGVSGVVDGQAEKADAETASATGFGIATFE